MKRKTTNDLDFDVTQTDYQVGLDDTKVKKSRGKFGHNVITHNAPKLWELILKELKQPILVLLIVAMIATFAIAIETVATPHKDGPNTLEIIPMFVEPCFILGIITFSVSFTILQEKKIAKTLITIKKLTETESVVIRNGRKEIVNAGDLVVGDIIEVSKNEIIGADCKLIFANDLEVNESILVGRELINLKDANFRSVDITPMEIRKNYIFKGTKVVRGNGLAIVTAVGNKTQLGILKQAVEQSSGEALSPLQKQIDKLSKILGAIAGAVCLIFFFLDVIASCHYHNITFGDNHAINSLSISISLAIAAIPEGLLAIVTVLLTACVKTMSARYVLVKKIPYVELLGFSNTIALEDKGVIDNEHLPIARIENFIKTDKKADGLKDELVYRLLSLFTLSNKEHKVDNEQITHFLRNHQLDALEMCANDELVNYWSDESSNLILTYNTITKEYTAVRLTSYSDIKAKNVKLEFNHKLAVEACVEDMKHDGLVSELLTYETYTELPNNLSLNNAQKFKLGALVGVTNTQYCIDILNDSHMTPIIMTEKSLEELKQDISNLDILNKENVQVCTGAQIKSWDDVELKDNIQNYNIFTGLDYQDKLRIVYLLKTTSNICLAGGNQSDEDSMREVNVACAFTRIATNRASDNSQVIITNNSLSSVISGIRLSRTVLLNIKSTLTLLLTANVSCLLTTFIGILVYMFQPLCSLQLLTINILAETAIGFPMANNVRRENVMKFKQLKPGAFIIDKDMALKIFIMGALAAGLSLLMFFIGAGAFYHYDYTAMTNGLNLIAGQKVGAPVETAEYAIGGGSSLAFMTLSLILLMNGMCYRTTGSIFTETWESSKRMFIVVAVCIAIVCIFNYIPKLNNVFQCDPYSFTKFADAHANEPNYQWLNIMPYLCLALNIGVHEVWKIVDNKNINKSMQPSQTPIIENSTI
ncbi:cation transporting ATPase C-terminal domain-containing protein [Ureaplasma ceti]|uniref:Cation-translocating P-type ATPase n=1 Tax=Ureaplasma ceti TaxID=3119530 RepID=A0ABP9UAC9_9BACT